MVKKILKVDADKFLASPTVHGIQLQGSKGTMYFKDEGRYYSYKLTKDGQPIDPNAMYEFGTLQELTCTSQRMAKLIAKGRNLTAVFG